MIERDSVWVWIECFLWGVRLGAFNEKMFKIVLNSYFHKKWEPKSQLQWWFYIEPEQTIRERHCLIERPALRGIFCEGIVRKVWKFWQLSNWKTFLVLLLKKSLKITNLTVCANDCGSALTILPIRHRLVVFDDDLKNSVVYW